MLAEPIARLSLDRRIIFKDDPALADRLDVQYLALSAIDFVMERSAIESGALPAAIVDHVAREAARVWFGQEHVPQESCGLEQLDGNDAATADPDAARVTGWPLVDPDPILTAALSEDLVQVDGKPG